MAVSSVIVWGIAFYLSSSIIWFIFLLYQLVMYFVSGMCIHRLYLQANRDSLTGVNNRRNFTSKISNLSKMKFPISLMIVDIDNFKMINDVYGHLAGDEVLKQIAEIFRVNIGRTELVSRWGGEEFTILLPNTNNENAFEFAEKLRSSIETSDFDIGVSKVSLTVSIGITTTTQAISPNKLVKKADVALHKAKETKNVVISFENSCK